MWRTNNFIIFVEAKKDSMEAIDYLMAIIKIRNFHPELYRFLSKVTINKETGCWEWTGAKWAGYGKFKFKGKYDGAHRVSYSLFVKDIDDGMLICHKCDNPVCVNPSHLFEGTYSDNAIDAINKGRMSIPVGDNFKRGHIAYNRALSDQIVILIKNDISNKVPMPLIAEKYGVKYQTVRDIKGDRAYQGVK